MQTNLINAQIPRGKRKLRVGDILPKRKPRPDDLAAQEAAEDEIDLPVVDPTAEPIARVRAQGERVRKKEARAAARGFWSGPEGRKISQLLDD